MKYESVLKELTSRGMFYVDLGLERISKILNFLNNPQESLKCIHIAGTNGKGSVCTILSSILSQAGYKVGLYTSPHIFEYTERIKIKNQDISKDDFCKYFQKVKSALEITKIHLTEFEILTVMMFLYFKDNNVDIVILETGMGGRLDATNVIKKNLCAIITHIDLDHTDRLGATKDEIAFEKAGIIKKDCPTITSMGYEAIRDKADELNSLLVFTSPNVPEEFVNSLSIKGLHQVENLALALTAINLLFKNIDEKTILEGLKNVRNPFRFQYFSEKNLIIDVAHNPNGINALKENLDYYFPNDKRRFVFGCLNTKDYKKMMQILFRDNDEIYFKEFNYPKACTYKELSKNCAYKANKFKDLAVLKPDKLNIICGSFYMLKELLPENFYNMHV